MNIKQKLTIVNRTVMNSRKIKYIVIHWVGAVSTAKNNVDYFYNTNRGASAHYFVDKNEIWQCVDDSDGAWHIGAKKHYNGALNSNSIGIEMCCVKDEQGNLCIDEDVVKKTAELTVYLMKKHGVSIQNVVRHYDCTR